VARCCLISLLGALSLAANPTLPNIPAAVFVVTAYGAVGDGVNVNTSAIQAAINAAEAAGGGTVEIPTAAAPYLSGPIVITGNVNLQIDAGATLQALPYGGGSGAPGTYPFSASAYAGTGFIALSGNNVEISGSGTIDGQGAAWWAAFNANPNIARPFLVYVAQASNVLVEDITLLNAPYHSCFLGPCANVTVDGISVIAPATSPNTDGVNAWGTHYLIEHCNLSEGDDNIAVGTGLGSSASTSDVTIQNCTIGHGHGISIGSATNAGVDGLTVTNCTFNGTLYGLRMKSDPITGGLVQNISYSGITMTNVQYPIVIYSYYDQDSTPGQTSGSNQATPALAQSWNAAPPSAAYDNYDTASMPAWQNITISNLTSTNPSGVSGSSVIWGLPNRYVAGVTLNNVNISGSNGIEIYNAQNVQLTGGTQISGSFVAYNAQVLTMQPQSQAIAAGGTAAFSVGVAPTSGANGPLSPSYRWSLNGQPLADGSLADGTSISGAAAAALTVGDAQPGEAGSYAVTIVEALDTYVGGLVPAGAQVQATSNSAALSVSPVEVAPSITAQPQSQALSVGASATFSVAATGEPAPSYQWNFNGSAIAGASGSTYVVVSAQVSNAGSYTVTVANAAGSVTSAPALLTVNSPAGVTGANGAGGGGGAPGRWFYGALAALTAVRLAVRPRLRKPKPGYDPRLSAENPRRRSRAR